MRLNHCERFLFDFLRLGKLNYIAIYCAQCKIDLFILASDKKVLKLKNRTIINNLVI